MKPQKIGQLFMIGIDGDQTPSKPVQDLIRKYNIGGVILFSRNIKNPKQCAQLTRALNACSKEVPLLIGVDQEGGRVSRLPKPFTQFPTARVVGQCNDIPMTYTLAEAMARELGAVGINMNFAPVLDIDTNPNNPIIGDRSFGPGPLLVEEHGLAMMGGLQDNHIIACGKHFPGHGDTSADSHKTLPVVDYPLSQMTDRELKPFIHTANNGLTCIMTAHVVYPKIDPIRPATLSKKVISSLLRGAVRFSGVVVSDDLEMKGITEKWSVAEAAPMAIEAGCDLLLVCESIDQQVAALESVIHRVEQGRISEARVEESVNRLQELKKRFLCVDSSGPDAIKKWVGSERHADLVREIEKKAKAAVQG
jgi:beta-N-acetylhexosaminidase